MSVMLIMALVMYEQIETANNDPERFVSEEVCTSLYARIHKAKAKLPKSPDPEPSAEPPKQKVISDMRKRQLGINW